MRFVICRMQGTLRVQADGGGRALAEKALNSLWDFHLLSLAAKRPCCSLYSVSRGWDTLSLTAANRNIIFNPFPPAQIEQAGLEWMVANTGKFNELIGSDLFNTSMRCNGNAHYPTGGRGHRMSAQNRFSELRPLPAVYLGYSVQFFIAVHDDPPHS